VSWRIVIGFVFICLSALSFGQSVALTFESAGDRLAWIGPAALEGEPKNAVKSSRNGIDLTDTSGGDTIYVRDEKTGNLASRKLSELKGSWAVKPTDFSKVFQIKVRVLSGEKSVAAGAVELSSGARKFSALLDPSLNGEVSIFGWPAGELTATVKTVVEGKPADPVKQVFTVALNRTDAVPTFSIAVPGKVATVGAVADAPVENDGEEKTSSDEPKTTGKSEKTEAAPSGPQFGNILAYILGLGAAGAAIYFGLQYYKQNTTSVNAQLTQLGVQIPKTDDLANAHANTPLPAAPAPQPVQKILLTDAAPDPVPVSAFSAPAASTGVLRLVSPQGDEIPLDGEVLVGREAGLGLSLTTESTVSRQHARLSCSGTTVTVTDLGSSNGTYVNGAKISTVVVLKPGDNVQFGQAKFRFEA